MLPAAALGSADQQLKESAVCWLICGDDTDGSGGKSEATGTELEPRLEQ